MDKNFDQALYTFHEIKYEAEEALLSKRKNASNELKDHKQALVKAPGELGEQKKHRQAFEKDRVIPESFEWGSINEENGAQEDNPDEAEMEEILDLFQREVKRKFRLLSQQTNDLL